MGTVTIDLSTPLSGHHAQLGTLLRITRIARHMGVDFLVLRLLRHSHDNACTDGRWGSLSGDQSR